jgi:hypothetical protein
LVQFHGVPKADFALGENPRIHSAPAGIKFLRYANELAVDERLFDGLAGVGERGNLEDYFIAEAKPNPGYNEVPIDALNGHILARGPDVDRMTLVLKGMDPFKGIHAHRPLRSTVVLCIVLSVV